MKSFWGLFWGIVVVGCIVAIASTYGQGYLVQQQAAWALAEAARLQAQTNLITAETLRAVIRQQQVYNMLIIVGLCLALWASLSQRIVYIPSDKGKE
jgi:hypothetical protein